MDIKYDRQKLSPVLEDVYTLLGTPISIFDRDFRFIASYPPEGYLTDFCRIIRESPERAELCRESDERACCACRTSERPLSYLCHAGICETVAPIRFESKILGYIMFGEYRRPDEDTDITAYAKRYGIDTDRLAEAYSRLTVLTDRQVAATSSILESCILKFRLSEAISLRESELAGRIKSFIDENLDSPLPTEEIARSFFISRQRLHTIFRTSFGTTVKKYILERKMARARELLRRSELSVAEVAEATGFADYNNFIQRFKGMVGVTPHKYRMENK